MPKRRSREGRHTARASTWMLRFNLVTNLDKAIKLITRGRVFIKGQMAQTKMSYYRIEKLDIKIKE